MNFGTETKLEGNRCPFCGKLTDYALGPASPQPGDVSVCMSCRNVNVFDEKMGLRKPTAEEACELAADLRIQEVKKAIKTIRAKFN